MQTATTREFARVQPIQPRARIQRPEPRHFPQSIDRFPLTAPCDSHPFCLDRSHWELQHYLHFIMPLEFAILKWVGDSNSGIADSRSLGSRCRSAQKLEASQRRIRSVDGPDRPSSRERGEAGLLASRQGALLPSLPESRERTQASCHHVFYFHWHIRVWIFFLVRHLIRI